MDAILIGAIDALFFAAVAAFGLVIGSFLNVVIYRVPKKESVVLPPSKCPFCGQKLTAKDNIPILSYLVLRGKCRNCGERISARYPIVEALTALIVMTAYLTFGGLTAKFFLGSFFLLVLFTVSVIDIDHKIIPNVIILPAIVFSAAVLLTLGLSRAADASLIDGGSPLYAAAGFLIGGGLLFLLALLWPAGMGGGDIKLAAFMGLFLGRYVIVALFLGFIFGSIGGITAMTVLKKGRKDQIPFGPYLAAGSAVTLYAGVPLATWYLGFFR